MGTCFVKIKFLDAPRHFVLSMDSSSSTGKIIEAIESEIMSRYVEQGGDQKIECGCEGEQFLDGSNEISDEQIEIFFCGQQLKIDGLDLDINIASCKDWCSHCQIHSDPNVPYGDCYCS